MRSRAAAAVLALLVAACLPHERPPEDVTRRLPRADATPRASQDPVEAARIENLWRVSMLEITRPVNPDGFAPFVANANPSVRAAAAVGLGRAGEAFGSTGGDAAPFVKMLLPLAADKSADVRGAAAFALGLVGESARGALNAPFAAEANIDVRVKWVRAAGRVAPLPPAAAVAVDDAPMVTTTAGNPAEPEMDLLRAALADDALAEPAALALGIYGLRCERAGVQPLVAPATLAALRARFANTLGAARAPFAYALWRVKQITTTADLRAGLVDPDPRVRALCARGLGAIPGTHARREVSRLLRDTNVWTRVEAARALPKLADADSATALDLVDMLERADPPATSRNIAAASPHAAVAAAEALGELHVRATGEALRARLTTDDPYLFAAVAGAWVKVAGLDAIPDLDETLTDRGGAGAWRFRKSIADALGGMTKKPPKDPASAPKADAGTPATEISPAVPFEAHAMFAALLGDSDERVQAAALDAYAELAGPSARARLVAALTSSSDIAIVGTAADRLTALDKDAGPSAAPALIAAFERFTKSSPDIAAGIAVDTAKLAKDAAIPSLEAAVLSPNDALFLAASKALRGMGRTPPPRTAAPSAAIPLADFLAAQDLTRATLKTSRGDIKLEMRPDIAPLMVWHLAQLSRKGFFHNLAFHRVVPAFVVQGGDPRSDGSGGSGTSVPCELNDLRYDRGAVGIALSARDTGDSQFFLTLTPQPHLEENYTVVGKMAHGADVLDVLQVGDPILDLSFP